MLFRSPLKREKDEEGNWKKLDIIVLVECIGGSCFLDKKEDIEENNL